MHDSTGPLSAETNTTMRASRNGGHLDTYVLEHATTPQFWLIGAFIVAFWVGNLVAIARYRRRSENHASAKKFPPTQRPHPTIERASSGEQHQMPAPKSLADKYHTPASQQVPPRFTAWLARYLTTRWHRCLAVTTYLAVLVAQLLEAYWVVVTLRRWTAKLFSLWPYDPWSWAYWVYFLPAGVMLLVDFSAVTFGGVIMMFQLTWLSELVLQLVVE